MTDPMVAASWMGVLLADMVHLITWGGCSYFGNVGVFYGKYNLRKLSLRKAI
jgi:hypothetical protein